MNIKKTIILSTTAILMTGAAATATDMGAHAHADTHAVHADNHTDMTVVTETTVTTETGVLTEANDTLGEFLQADGDADPEADRKILMYDGDQTKKSVVIAAETDNRVDNNAIVVPTLHTDVITTVSCPVGTTAQADMTCLITGNFDYNQ